MFAPKKQFGYCATCGKYTNHGQFAGLWRCSLHAPTELLVTTEKKERYFTNTIRLSVEKY